MAEILGDILWYRGDSYPLTMTIKDKKTKEVVPLTGYSFKLAVDPQQDPVDDSEQIFQVDGVLDGDPTTGRVSFTPTSLQTDFGKGSYWFGIQMIDASGNVKTIAKYKWKQSQDINK